MRALQLFVVTASFIAAACGGAPVDLTKSLQIDVVETGWYDSGIINGQWSEYYLSMAIEHRWRCYVE